MRKNIPFVIAALAILIMPFSASADFQVKGCSKKTAVHFNEQQAYTFCYKPDAVLVAQGVHTADIKEMGADGTPSSTVSITYYKDGDSPEKVMAWMSQDFRGRAVKGKNLKNKKNVIGFYYDWYATQDHGGGLLEHGVFLINKKSKDNEFVKISFDSKEKAIKTLLKTFKFTGSGIVNDLPFKNY